MPPSPGRIHDLPIKILYSLDTSPQSYVTVLPERQQVYIHPSSGPAHASSQEGLLGSCYLKAAVRGICFASPECIPNASSLDFSVYNLDPLPRPTGTRAFHHPAAQNGALDESWTGKGFLSWIISESGTGKTLIKGRLVRETEFSSMAFNEQGGLEGLMAAAAARQSAPQREDMDGKGWGLEVGISLRMVNPDGKDEFKGRREFEDMMRRGILTSVGTSATTATQGRASSVANSSPVSVASVASATPRAHHPEPIRRNPPSASSTSRGNAGANGNANGSMGMPAMPNFHHSSSNASVHSHSHSHSVRPSPALGHQSLPHLPAPNRPASASSRMSQPSSLPPSSIPMSASSSAGAGPSNPPQRPSSAASTHRPTPQHAQASYSSQSQHQQNNGLSAHASSSTHVASSRVRSREITPPPLPQRKSPPPSTPSREKLAALLRTDEKMSPSMAKHLAQNPVLLKLLKAVPPTALNFGHDVKVGSGLANSSTNGNGNGTANGSPDSEGAPTPTPSGPTAPSSNSKPAQKGMTTSAEGCCNCGVKESELWRTKAMKDGTKKKVCNACGLYFNKHKRMRPAELWGTPATDDPAPAGTNSHSTQMPPEKKIKLDEREPVRHSPRLARNVSSDHTNPPAFSSVAESPRRKRASKPIPQPSPRMATRASSRYDPTAPGQTSASASGTTVAQALDFSDSLFSPSTMFGTSPAVPAQQPNHALGVDSTNGFGGAGTGNGMGEFGGMDLGGEIDIEALLNSIAAADGQNGFSLDAFFASNADGAEGTATGVDMSGWVHDGDAGGAGGAVGGS